jgi:hypothetical protein
MVTYPIQIRRDSYRGNDASKKAKRDVSNEIAMRLESHINSKLFQQLEPVRVYNYSELASDTGIDYQLVRDLGYSIDCGSGGFTAYKRGLTQEEAMDIAAKGTTR